MYPKNYALHVGCMKALADTNRLMIVDMLSCGELCACEILEAFHFTQPTLSHHMKTLCECGLVSARKEGKWMHYSLNESVVQSLRAFLSDITTNKEQCICKTKNRARGGDTKMDGSEAHG